MGKSFIIFDGNCGFCNKTIMLIAKNDKNNNFKFVSNLSVFGINLLSKHQIRGLEKSTIILIEKDDGIYSNFYPVCSIYHSSYFRVIFSISKIKLIHFIKS